MNHPDKLTREFFEQDRRASILRNICLIALDASVNVLTSRGVNQDATYLLNLSDTHLEAAGITPGQHMIAPDDPDRTAKKQQMGTDPVMTVEWVAGQLRQRIAEANAFSGSDSLDAINEHDTLQGSGDGIKMIDTQAMGPRTQEFILNMGLVGTLLNFIDAEAGFGKVSET